VRFVRGAAKGISHQDDAETPVDRAKHRGELAYVDFTARITVSMPGATQLSVQVVDLQL